MKSICIAVSMRKSLVIWNILLTSSALISSRADAGLIQCSGRLRPRIRLSALRETGIRSVTWSPDGSRLAAALGDDFDGTIKIWRISGAVVRSWSAHPYLVRSVRWSPDGTRIASIGGDGYYCYDEECWLFPDPTLRIWAADTGELLQTLTGSSNGFHSLAWSPDGARIAGGFQDGTIRIWRADTGDLLQTMNAHSNIVMSLAWSPDGGRIASGGAYRDNTIKIWDADWGDLVRVMPGHQAGVSSLQWSPDGFALVSGSEDRTVRVWPGAMGFMMTIGHHNDAVTSVDWSRNDIIASGSNDMTIRLWQVIDSDPHDVYAGVGVVLSLAWSPDGCDLAVADGTASIWTRW